MAQAVKTPQVGETTTSGSEILSIVEAAPRPNRIPGVTRAKVEVRNLKGKVKVEEYIVIWR